MSEQLKSLEEMQEEVFECRVVNDLKELGGIIVEDKDEENNEINHMAYLPVKEGLMMFHFMIDYENPSIIYEGVDTQLVDDDSSIKDKIKALEEEAQQLKNLLTYIK